MRHWETPRPSSTGRRLRVSRLALTAAVTVPLAVSGAAAAKPSKKPDLVVKSGSFTVSKGQLRATFKVKNVGSAKAGSSSAAASTVESRAAVLLGTAAVPSLGAGRSTTVTVKAKLSALFISGKREVSVCVDRNRKLAESSETNNCLDLGTYASGTITPATGATPTATPVDVPTPKGPGTLPFTPVPTGTPAPATTPKPTTTPVPTATPAPTPTGPQPRPTSTVPTAPLAGINVDDASKIDSGAGTYWVYIPNSYDQSGKTPIRVLVWMHGCGGMSSGDIYTESLGGDAQNYITMAPVGPDSGRDDDCWNVNTDPAKVWAMVADLETHFNIDRRRVILGGYSSGGDMTYRMAFDNAYDVAGTLVANSQPFGDSGLDDSAIAKAYWKFNVFHLAHTGDGTYHIATVKSQLDELKNAGFPVTLTQRPGDHIDDNTDQDIRDVLLPKMVSNDWQAPPGP